MDTKLNKVLRGLIEAKYAEDVFGTRDVTLPPSMLLNFLQEPYDKLKRIADPKAYQGPEEKEVAAEAAAKLEFWLGRAKERISKGIYGLVGYGVSPPAHLKTAIRVGENSYTIGEKITSGTKSSLYRAYFSRQREPIGEVVIKLVDDVGSNALMQNELRILDLLHRKEVPQWKHLPFVFDRFTAKGRVGAVLRRFEGYTLQQVHAHPSHSAGLDPRHMIWMLDRALSALGYAHSLGIVHGNLSPENLMVSVPDHNMLITGWSSAAHRPAVSGEKITEFTETFSAPEVKAGGEIGPWSDIYSLGKIMIWLLGGNPETNEIPESVEEPLRNFLRDFVTESRGSRPQNAWKLWEQENALKDALWPRKFLHLDMT